MNSVKLSENAYHLAGLLEHVDFINVLILLYCVDIFDHALRAIVPSGDSSTCVSNVQDITRLIPTHRSLRHFHGFACDKNSPSHLKVGSRTDPVISEPSHRACHD